MEVVHVPRAGGDERPPAPAIYALCHTPTLPLPAPNTGPSIA